MSDPIARIEDALRRLGADHAPPVGWEDRVLARAREPAPHARRSFYRQHWWLMVAPVLVVAGLLLWLVQAAPSPATDEPVVSWRIDPRTNTRGIGSDGAVGDLVHAQIAGGRGYRALRVYRRGVLILDCHATPDGQVSQDVLEPGDSEAPSCTLDHGTLVLTSVLRAAGTYQLLGLSSPSPLPASQRNFALDQAAAIDAKLDRQSLVKSFEVE